MRPRENMTIKGKQPIEEIRKLCTLTGVDFELFLQEVLSDLEVRVRHLLRPNKEWFNEGKSIKRYLDYLRGITGYDWDPMEAYKWFKLLRYPSKTRDEITASQRYRVIERDKSICQKCGRRAPDVELHVDHILPWNLGGPTVIDNLQVLCSQCNEGKSAKYLK